MSEKKGWNVADEEGNIHVPDELDGLVNKIEMLLRLFSISGKNEIQTVVDIAYIAQQYFNKPKP